jgi:hypothetical protein
MIDPIRKSEKKNKRQILAKSIWVNHYKQIYDKPWLRRYPLSTIIINRVARPVKLHLQKKQVDVGQDTWILQE